MRDTLNSKLKMQGRTKSVFCGIVRYDQVVHTIAAVLTIQLAMPLQFVIYIEYDAGTPAQRLDE